MRPTASILRPIIRAISTSALGAERLPRMLSFLLLPLTCIPDSLCTSSPLSSYPPADCGISREPSQVQSHLKAPAIPSVALLECISAWDARRPGIQSTGPPRGLQTGNTRDNSIFLGTDIRCLQPTAQRTLPRDWHRHVSCLTDAVGPLPMRCHGGLRISLCSCWAEKCQLSRLGPMCAV